MPPTSSIFVCLNNLHSKPCAPAKRQGRFLRRTNLSVSLRLTAPLGKGSLGARKRCCRRGVHRTSASLRRLKQADGQWPPLRVQTCCFRQNAGFHLFTLHDYLLPQITPPIHSARMAAAAPRAKTDMAVGKMGRRGSGGSAVPTKSWASFWACRSSSWRLSPGVWK